MNKSIALAISLILLATTVTGCDGGSEPAPTEAPTTTPIPVPTPAGPSLGDTRTRPADGMVMVYVPAGEFQMGSTDEELDQALELCIEPYADCQRGWLEREQPAHTVALDSFWIDRTEVTNAQFAVFLNGEGNQEEAGETWLYLEHEYCLIERVSNEYHPENGYGDHPAIMVSWYGAAAYCEWAGGRLPTEAEWEYAARGPEGRVFPWGDTFDGTRLNYCDVACENLWADESFADGYVETAPVDSYPNGVSWCEALDLAGNVNEWVADWYGEYGSAQQENPTGPEFGEDRVVRGGNWHLGWNHTRTADRLDFMPGAHVNDLGFRCVVSPGE